MKKIVSLFILLLFALSCDEEGVLITVPSTGNYSFSINADEANAGVSNSFTTSRLVDPSALFAEDAELIKNIVLDRLTYEISGYSGTSGNPVVMNLRLATRLNDITTEVLSANGVNLQNGLVTAFEKGKTSTSLSSAQIASIEAIIGYQEPFDLIITAGFDKSIESSFTIEVVWNVTASISQPAAN